MSPEESIDDSTTPMHASQDEIVGDENLANLRFQAAVSSILAGDLDELSRKNTELIESVRSGFDFTLARGCGGRAL